MQVFTLGQVAKICHVNVAQAQEWFSSGKITGYRIPGSQDARIPRENLVTFLKGNDMPPGLIEETAIKVLVVTQDQELGNCLSRELPLKDGYWVTGRRSGFEACMEAVSSFPDCIVVDFSIGAAEALAICRNIRTVADCDKTIVIGIHEEGSPMACGLSVVDASFTEPFEAAALVERLRALIDARTQPA